MTQQIKMDFDIPVTMRDGVVLRANVLRPADDGTYPVALTRIPYGKDFSTASPILDALRLAKAGYIVIIQDVRGRFASEGSWSPFVSEGDDGYDTVEWAAALPGSSGKVGMFGASYFGFTQWAAAMKAPPHLMAIMPTITWSDARGGLQWRGGAMELGLVAFWQISLASDVLLKRYKDAPLPEQMQAARALVNEINRLRTEGVFSLPLREFEPFRRLDIAPEFFEQITRPNDRAFNALFSVAEAYDKVKVPAYNIGGWYDIFSQGTLQNFCALRTGGSTPEARQAKVLIGPWSHVNYSNVVGDIDFGLLSHMSFMNLQTDLTALTQRWFDYWLKGIETGITQEPPVKLFIMGDNVWRDEQEWPLARTQFTRFYLHHTGSAREGVLSSEMPGEETADQYTFDPRNPTPTQGGAILMHELHKPGARDQRTIEARDDVLVYTSEALAHELEVTGPIVVKLWAASDARDTDFVARLVDVHPDGFAQNLTDGIIRARYRNGDRPELLNPGQPYEFTIDLWSTANVFKIGHRIRLDIASANFPRWDRNPNTGAPLGDSAALQPARQTILHDAAHASYVVLPVIPR